MATSTKTQQLYGEYINPTVDKYSSQKENPLVLMAQACNNIGKESSLTLNCSPSLSSSSHLLSSKLRKSNSLQVQEVRKSLKRSAPATFSSQTIKRSVIHPLSHFCQSSIMLDSLFNYHLNKRISLPTFDLSLLSTLPLLNSSFSSSYQQSPYFTDTIFLSPFVCNWIDSNISNGFCGKRFTNHIHLLEHLCTEHTSTLSTKSPCPSYYSSTLIEKL
ncbi:unnamed protein product [Rotaria magnacalcarata]|uniref:C2H2-type domain-containing protein n=1 Tax=Rotaria magnacalcarata TaxID=392030 RepID=A0A816V272_9BILA|nr:unnamed protein product [Rotaria magnacalcarata]CAF2118926.1 unnamed protein product [Rotaria magnacalcarata]CAF4000940.1 unnamed protein product [Rotaria magnacalcarata]CAF4161318.1 unnamed protein product [Rotaria magnacalcarata]